MDFQTAQTEVVQRIASDFGTADYVHAVVDLELLELEDGYDLEYQAILITPAPGGDLASRQFQLSEHSRKAIIAFYRERKDNFGHTLGGFVLRIDHSDRYRFEFNYDAPAWLNRVSDAERQAYFDNYLKNYRREVRLGSDLQSSGAGRELAIRKPIATNIDISSTASFSDSGIMLMKHSFPANYTTQQDIPKTLS